MQQQHVQVLAVDIKHVEHQLVVVKDIIGNKNVAHVVILITLHTIIVLENVVAVTDVNQAAALVKNVHGIKTMVMEVMKLVQQLGLVTVVNLTKFVSHVVIQVMDVIDTIVVQHQLVELRNVQVLNVVVINVEQVTGMLGEDQATDVTLIPEHYIIKEKIKLFLF